MAHALSLVAEDDNSIINVPEDGDDLAAADVETIIQKIANRSVMHRTALLGHVAWTERMAVLPGGSLTSFSIEIGGILRMVGDDSNGVRRATGAAATTITQAKIEGGGGTLGAQARWWYVYGFLTPAIAIDYAISLTGPAAFGRTKDGDTTRVYLGCFPTDTTGAPIPLRAVRGRYLYRRSALASVASALASNGLRAVGAGGTGLAPIARTALDLSSRVPPHSQMALVQATCSVIASGSSALAAINLYTAADTAAVAVVIEATAQNNLEGSENTSSAEVELTSAQVMGYSITASSAGVSASIDVLGFLE